MSMQDIHPNIHPNMYGTPTTAGGVALIAQRMTEWLANRHTTGAEARAASEQDWQRWLTEAGVHALPADDIRSTVIAGLEWRNSPEYVEFIDAFLAGKP